CILLLIWTMERLYPSPKRRPTAAVLMIKNADAKRRLCEASVGRVASEASRVGALFYWIARTANPARKRPPPLTPPHHASRGGRGTQRPRPAPAPRACILLLILLPSRFPSARDDGRQQIRAVRAAGVQRHPAAEYVGRPVVGIVVGHAAGAAGGVMELLAEVRDVAGVLIVLAAHGERERPSGRHDDAAR